MHTKQEETNHRKIIHKQTLFLVSKNQTFLVIIYKYVIMNLSKGQLYNFLGAQAQKGQAMKTTDFNTTTTGNILNLGNFDFSNLDKPNRGKQTLALIRINKKTLDSGSEKYTFCFLNQNNQSIYIDVFAEQMRSWFDRIRLVTGITAEGNALINELQKPHEFIVKDNEKGFPQFDFMQMLGLTK